jgi:hypothetical protein
VRFKENLPKNTLSFKGEGGTSESHKFWQFSEFHPWLFLSSAPPLLYFHSSYL